VDSPYGLYLLLAIPLLAAIPAWVARRKGRDFLTWYLYGVFLLPAALIHAFVLDASGSAKVERAETKLFDVAVLVLFVAAGAAFLLGADAITTRKDVNAIYWMVVGIVLVRGASNLARAERATG